MRFALLEDRAWELLSAWSGLLCNFVKRAAGGNRVEGLAILEERSFRGEVERGALLMVADPGGRLDISVISGSLGSTNSTLFFDFFSYSTSSSSVISMIAFSFRFFAASRSFSKAALVGCKEGHQFYV